MAKQVQAGAVKYANLKAACEAHGADYMATYMRIRNGWSVSKALRAKVRGYKERAVPLSARSWEEPLNMTQNIMYGMGE